MLCFAGEFVKNKKLDSVVMQSSYKKKKNSKTKQHKKQ